MAAMQTMMDTPARQLVTVQIESAVLHVGTRWVSQQRTRFYSKFCEQQNTRTTTIPMQ